MDLDDVIPNPQYQICHSRVARALLPAVWDALHRVTMTALPLGHALFSERPHVVIAAGLSQAWRLLGGSVPSHLDAAALRAWSQPGWIKAGWNFASNRSRQEPC